MPDLTAIADVGGWAFSGFVSLSIIVGFIRGDLVPGFVHRREIDRGDRLEAAAVPVVIKLAKLERGLDRCRTALQAANRRHHRVDS